MAKTKTNDSWLHPSVLRLSRLHFLYIVPFIAQIFIYDSWKLITPEVVLWRWVATGLLLIVTAAVWYAAHNRAKTTAACKWLVWILVSADIFIASFNVYTQRGMASRAVMLYAIPLVVSSVLLSRAALFATAAFCMAAYFITTVAYFVLNFNEGYKIELYGEVGFYTAIFFILAMLLWSVVRSKRRGN